MKVLQAIKTAVSIEPPRGTVTYECGTGGTNVNSEEDDCPYCGPTSCATIFTDAPIAFTSLSASVG